MRSSVSQRYPYQRLASQKDDSKERRGARLKKIKAEQLACLVRKKEKKAEQERRDWVGLLC